LAKQPIAMAKKIVVAEDPRKGRQKLPPRLSTPHATSETANQWQVDADELQQLFPRLAVVAAS
jgi:hypothetical protein